MNPLNNEQLGYYLAGLIDGDGHFSKAQQLVITFSSPDAFSSLARWFNWIRILSLITFPNPARPAHRLVLQRISTSSTW